MLKRYNRFTAYCSTDFIPQNLYYQANMFPYLRGNVAGAVHLTGALASYNYCNTVLLHWVTYAFSGWRGSIRWKMIPKHAAKNVLTTVSRHCGGSSGGCSFLDAFASSYSTTSEGASTVVYQSGTRDQVQSGHEGVAYTNSEVNPVLEWEMPYYNKYRFTPGKIENLTQALDNMDYFTLNTGCWEETQVSGTIDSPTTFELWCAAGEDFQTYFWTGLPRMYYEPTPPAS
jgi:hypothetical protein